MQLKNTNELKPRDIKQVKPAEIYIVQVQFQDIVHVQSEERIKKKLNPFKF